jgi:hypothetical protein
MVNIMAKLTKVEKTQNLLTKEIDKAGGVDKLNRSKILATMQKRFDMSPAQSSTYYHNALNKLAG